MRKAGAGQRQAKKKRNQRKNLEKQAKFAEDDGFNMVDLVDLLQNLYFRQETLPNRKRTKFSSPKSRKELRLVQEPAKSRTRERR